ncbi:MAG TPA: hypothetical protein EYP46_02970 [Hadesarchaea archaeon]|nr:hypothetical protein [Hadesarchaea archaeon]
MRLVHYQTLEAVAGEELQALQRIRSRFNEHRSFVERIKLWRKSDILEELEPKDARWGFSRLHGDKDKPQLLSTLRRMSRATPRLTWVLYDEDNGGEEVMLRGGRRVA